MELLLKEIEGNAIQPFYAILKKCGEEMHNKLHLSHWYPFIDEESFINSLKNKHLYGVYQNNIPVATFNVSTTPRDYYSDSLWNIPADKALYLGHLAIDPTSQGGGIGKWCLEQIHRIARELDCSVIRFDALAIHPWLKNFYYSQHFSSCGIVKPSEWELLCFEKRVEGNTSVRYEPR